ncbi:crotonase/enoyl-CoA hydratase family protein [Rhabdothermincola sediminis]|uniref:crotonase/enoyl-CoA hydratase family protein n=1 Tax=Rhabdothermincola sediminis TaxID=2751370 RepID=UPI001AA06551|nr:crotonase/enoyl-CoA hydratase family protein [Rhabdothermincola sediminis]
MSDPHLLFERDGHVAIVTLNRPEKKNALSSQMLVRMYDAWVEIDRDPQIRVAIVTGAGGNFCSGADLKAMAAGHPDDEYTKRFAQDGDLHWKALLRHFVPGKPMIAAVEGYAVAGGTEILQAFDIRVAGESAQFGVAEVRRGLFPLGGSTVRLSRQIPYTVAAELLLTGRFMPAEEALRVGLIGHVVPDGSALDKAREIAAQIAENGPLAVQAVLKSMRATREMPEKVGLAYELEIGSPIFQTEDAIEGPTAFAEKRKPQFKGR